MVAAAVTAAVRTAAADVASLVKGAAGLKLKEVPGYVRASAGENLVPGKLWKRVEEGMVEYKEKYIDTGKSKPFWDYAIGLFVFSYVLSWPGVRPGQAHLARWARTHSVHNTKSAVQTTTVGCTLPDPKFKTGSVSYARAKLLAAL